ncbi:MAG: hypothetical protein NT096_15120 [Proteobacteria bacterium]|nr:hypothetical protein [Pseudomonadota bacterium]
MKVILILACIVFVSFVPAFGSSIEFLPVADGTYHYHYECQCTGSCYEPFDCWWSEDILTSISVASHSFTAGEEGFYYFHTEDNFTGIIELDITPINGLFSSGQLQATLIFTIQSVANPLSNNFVYLDDIKDENENGIIEASDFFVQSAIGTASFSDQAQPGDTIQFDVTQAVEHDLFGANQTAYSGFVLMGSGSPLFSGYPMYTFYDHTSPEYTPKLIISETTLIRLSSFTATPSDRKVILEWVTESEIDNAGFNLYRAESEDGEYVKINPSLIPAKGSPTQGATYQFIDDDVKNHRTYYYKLEDVDLNGTNTMHGPVSAEPRGLLGMGK